MLRFVLAEEYGLVKVGVAENPQNAVDANFPLLQRIEGAD